MGHRIASPSSLATCFLLPLAEEAGKKQATQARTAQQATGNQHARQLVVLTATFLLLLAALVLFHVLSLAEETGKKQTTQARTAQQATGNQHARQPVIRTAAFLLLLAALVLFHVLSLAEETGKKQTTHASTAQQATDSQLTDKLLLVSAALCFVIWTKVYIFVEQSVGTHYVLLSVCPFAPPCVSIQGSAGYCNSAAPWTVDKARLPPGSSAVAYQCFQERSVQHLAPHQALSCTVFNQWP